MKPNFFIIGAAKCGTTSLFHYLGQHPDVYISVPKEPRFFELNSEYERGLGFYWDKYFKTWAGETAVGDANPFNLYLPYVAYRIKQTVSQARLVVILRNPVDRAYSHWCHRHIYHDERLSFEDALGEDVHRIEQGLTFEGDEGAQRWVRNMDLPTLTNEFRTYLDIGYYSNHINRYMRLFPPEQIKIILLEDMSRNPEQVVRDVWKFLKVDSDYTLSDARPQNEGYYRGLGFLLNRAVRSTARLTKLKYLIPLRLRRNLSWTLSQIGPKSKMSPKTRSWLIKHYYRYNRESVNIVRKRLKALGPVSTWSS